MSDDRNAVLAAAQTYLDGLHEGDADKIAGVFHPTSCLTMENAGSLVVTPRDQWLEAVRNRASPKAQGSSRHDEILQIDLAGPGTAFVRLKCAIPPRFFTDYLCFLKIDGRWQVVQKIFAVEHRQP